MTENAYFCQTCGKRDDDWFLCRKEGCKHKRSALPKPDDDFRERAALAALTGLLASGTFDNVGSGFEEFISGKTWDIADALDAERARRARRGEG